LAFATHVAVVVHVPLVAVIVTLAPLIVQTRAVPVKVGVRPVFEVAATVKVDSYGAVGGAPVKVTVGVAFVAVVL
jgi:hypothetical protein